MSLYIDIFRKGASFQRSEDVWSGGGDFRALGNDRFHEARGYRFLSRHTTAYEVLSSESFRGSIRGLI